jgi:hypothetical protein
MPQDGHAPASVVLDGVPTNSDGTVTLYRAMSQTEFDKNLDQNQFTYDPQASGGNSHVYFSPYQSDAEWFGNNTGRNFRMLQGDFPLQEIYEFNDPGWWPDNVITGFVEGGHVREIAIPPSLLQYFSNVLPVDGF